MYRHSARIVTRWSGRHGALLTIHGTGDNDLVERLGHALDRLLRTGGAHLVVDLHGLVGDDTAVLELLAATCHRVWAKGGTVMIGGVGHRLVSRPEVSAFPEVFGEVPVAS